LEAEGSGAALPAVVDPGGPESDRCRLEADELGALPTVVELGPAGGGRIPHLRDSLGVQQPAPMRATDSALGIVSCRARRPPMTLARAAHAQPKVMGR